MSYKTKYLVNFADIKAKKYRVEIQEENYAGEAKELIGAATPFIVNIESNDDVFSPLRLSTATLSVVAKEDLPTLFSVTPQQHKVVFKQDGNVVWSGFVRPEVYTQDFSRTVFRLEIECCSAMSTLEYIDYGRINESDRAFISVFDIIKRAVNLSNGNYNKIYFPFTYSIDKTDQLAKTNVLEKLSISEQNFFDEENKPMKMLEVLEEICKAFCWTMHDWKGDLYFIDLDNRDKEYICYDGDFTNKKIVILSNEQTTRTLGAVGSNHSLSVLAGYNKATIKCSNYLIGSLFPEENYKGEVIHTRKVDITWKIKSKGKRTDVKVRNKYVSSDILTLRRYIAPNGNDWREATEEEIKAVAEIIGNAEVKQVERLAGCHPIVVRSLVKDKGKVTKREKFEAIRFSPTQSIRLINTGTANRPDWYNYVDNSRFITGKYRPQSEIMPISNERPYLEMQGAFAVFQNGAFVLSGEVRHDGEYKVEREHDTYGDFNPSMYSEKTYIEETKTPIVTDYAYDRLPNATFSQARIEFVFVVGDKYYNGANWVTEPSSFYVDLDLDKFEKFTFQPLGNNENEDEEELSKAKGRVIRINKGDALVGAPRLSIVSVRAITKNTNEVFGMVVKGLKIEYVPLSTDDEAELSDEKENTDRIYENVVNEKFINELDEIEHKISTYNDDGACYSKLLIEGKKYLQDDLYSHYEEKKIRLEESKVKRLVSHYKDPKTQLSHGLRYQYDTITPNVVITEAHTPNKRYVIVGGEIDYKKRKTQLNMLEFNNE